MRLLSAFLVLLWGCSPHSNDDPPCPGPRPAFRLQINGVDERPLPDDTEVQVEYGGDGKEVFLLKTPSVSPQVLFCTPTAVEAQGGAGGEAGASAGQGGEAGAGSGGQGGGGAAGAGAAGATSGGAAGNAGAGGAKSGGAGGYRQLKCELWTDGAANVKIKGQGLKTYERALAAVSDKCGISTTLMQVQLEGAAGAGGDSDP